jgi:hypothetical protein
MSDDILKNPGSILAILAIFDDFYVIFGQNVDFDDFDDFWQNCQKLSKMSFLAKMSILTILVNFDNFDILTFWRF